MIDELAGPFSRSLAAISELLNSDGVIAKLAEHPFLIALIATLFGVLVGARLTVKANTKAKLVNEIEANYLLSCDAALVCSGALNLKKLRLMPMKAEYDAARQEFMSALESGKSSIRSVINLIDMPRPNFSLSGHSTTNLGITNFGSQDLAQLNALQTAIQTFVYFWDERRGLINEYRFNERGLTSQEQAFWYFGTTAGQKGVDARYLDNMNNIVRVLDDVIFHSYRLYVLSAVNCVVLKRRLSWRESRQIAIGTANFKDFFDERVFPDFNQYSSWLVRHRPKRVSRWWWSEQKVKREATRMLTKDEDGNTVR